MTEKRQREKFIDSFNYITQDNSIELFCEVPVFCRSVDLVIFNKCDNSITAVEFKIKNWKRAIEQALSVSISFDFLAICLVKPQTEKSIKTIIDKCEQLGIGLYYTSNTENEFKVTHPVVAKPISKTWITQKQSLINYLERCGSFAWEEY